VTTLLADSIAASYLSAISYHTYYVDGGPDQWNAKFEQIAELAARKNLAVYFTEIGTTPWYIPNTTWPWAFDCMQMWHNILTRGNASLGFQWALLGKDYAVNPDATRNPIFHALQQFFLHVPIGAVRIAAQSDHRDLLVSAFKHAEKKRAQIVLINRSPAALQVDVNLKNLNVPAWQSYRSAANANHIRDADYHVVNHNFSFTIPANSVTTLDGALAPVKDVVPPAPPTGARVIEQ
jgi:O-glycosyl hydrolase